MPEQLKVNLYEYPKANVGKRILAYFIDTLIALLPVAIFIPLAIIPFFAVVRTQGTAEMNINNMTNIGAIITVVIAVLISLAWSFLYYLLRDGFGAGQSWGKKACGLMVVNLDNNMPCDKGKSFVRNIFAWLFTAVLGWVPVINALAGLAEPIIALIHEKGQRVGDMVGRTQVIDLELYSAPAETDITKS